MDTTLSAPIGQLLDGRYLVEAQIARGGMATVYHARDVRLERAVALKIAHPELAHDREFVARFISEARSAARLSSPNVVSVYDQGSAGELHYIAMEYVPGPTLRELLVARGRLNPREALDIVERVLAGLAAAHEAGIIHRDVKPENVLLGNGTSVKVADFGLARAAAGVSHTKTGMLIGTAAYLAPEQVASNTSDERTDVYATGVMLFEMLTGVQPHTGDSPLTVAYKHVNAVVPAPSTLVPELPSALDTLVAIGTSRDPDLRPPDARHYLHAITEVRRGMPLPPSPPRRSASVQPGAAGPSWPGTGSGPAGTALAGTALAGDPGTGGSAPDGSRAPGQNATGQIGRVGQPGADGYGSQAGAGNRGTNHTMIVPAGMTAEFGDGGGDPGQGQARRLRRADEPWLQRWLFSRRILILLAVVLVALGSWWFTDGRYLTVPSVAGMTVSTARGDLTNAGLHVRTGTGRHSDSVTAGQVLSTEPAAGTKITHGGSVTIIPSLGPVLVTMPPVTGMPLAQAEHTLKVAGFLTAPPSYQTSASIPSGVVISTSPVAYQHWPKTKPVTIVVSDGPPLPNFVGQQFSAAQATAALGGYTLNQVTAAKNSQPAGTIIGQSPAASTPITAGEVVTVQVSAGPPEVAIPDVQGMNANRAESELTAAGFTVTENQIGPGSKVISYSPTGQAPQGSTITITVGFSF